MIFSLFFFLSGQHVLSVFDHYIAGWSLLFTATLEITIIAYIYGKGSTDALAPPKYRPEIVWIYHIFII